MWAGRVSYVLCVKAMCTHNGLTLTKRRMCPPAHRNGLPLWPPLDPLYGGLRTPAKSACTAHHLVRRCRGAHTHSAIGRARALPAPVRCRTPRSWEGVVASTSTPYGVICVGPAAPRARARYIEGHLQGDSTNSAHHTIHTPLRRVGRVPSA